MAVNPTISLKKIVTELNVSGCTVWPFFSSSATNLEQKMISKLINFIETAFGVKVGV